MGLIPTHGTALAEMLLEGGLTPERRLTMAQMTMQTLTDYERPSYPERPALLVLEDHELLDAYRTWSVGAKPKANEIRALGFYGAWRLGVWSAEGRAGALLLTLIESAMTFERENLRGEADLLWSFAEDQYPGFVRADVPESLHWRHLREWCLLKVRDYALLPRYMRIMKSPKGGVPFHKPQGERGPFEPPPGQGDMWD